MKQLDEATEVSFNIPRSSLDDMKKEILDLYESDGLFFTVYGDIEIGIERGVGPSDILYDNGMFSVQMETEKTNESFAIHLTRKQVQSIIEIMGFGIDATDSETSNEVIQE